MSVSLADDGNESAHATDLFHVDFSHTGHPLAVVFVIVLISFLKAWLTHFKNLPESGLLLVFGTIVGIFLQILFTGEFYLRPDWFFTYLLPPIALDAGYFLKNKDFFHNIATISVYAVVGTLLNTAAVAATLYVCRSWFTLEMPLLHIILFATLICAVDPVAVLSVFESIHVNELLYICVFGESLLNDAVTIVLYHMMINLIIANPVAFESTQIVKAVGSFAFVSVGGIGIGVIGGLLIAFIMKMMVNHQPAQPIIMLMLPVAFYLISDTFHLSGILSIVTCGILVKNYMRGNLCEEMHFTLEYILRHISSYSEFAIFIFLGISMISSNHIFDWWFITITLAACLIYRFIGVYALTAVINRFRHPDDRISFVDQFVMAYGGIRGAVCYGLVMSIDIEMVPAKNMMVTATLAVILFTTIIQGVTIKPLVCFLKVKRSKSAEEEKKRVFETVTYEVTKQVRDFVENLTSTYCDYYLYRKVREFDNKYLKRYLVAYYRPRTADIIEMRMDQELTEMALSNKKSFVGMPSNASVASLHLPTSSSQLFAAGYKEDMLSRPTLEVPKTSSPAATLAPQTKSPPIHHAANNNDSLPRNVSVTGLVEHAFEESEHQRTIAKGQRRSIYSRHVLPMAASPVPFAVENMSLESDEEGAVTYRFTLPSSGDQSARLAHGIRQLSKSVKDPNKKSRFSVTPVRSQSTRQGALSPRAGGVMASIEKRTKSPAQGQPRFSIVNEESDSNPSSTRSTSGPRTPKRRQKATFSVDDDDSDLLLIDATARSRTND